jgi:predicted transposase YbfD/YdcC
MKRFQLKKGSIARHFYMLSEFRQEKKVLHRLINIIIIAVCAVARGADNFKDIGIFAAYEKEWFETFLDLPNGVPSHDTIERVFKGLNPDEFRKCFMRWVREVAKLTDGDIVAIDGKTVRGSKDGESRAIHIISAWASANHLMLGQAKVEEKTNEIKAIPELIKLLAIKGCIVTTDALGCQKDIAKEIIAAKANYVLALKENQETLYNDVKLYFEDKLCEKQLDKNVEFKETIDNKHGRHEIRKYYVTKDLSWLSQKPEWMGLKIIGMVESERQEKGKEKSIERRFYIGSIADDVSLFAKAVRNHWGIENSLHWVLDVVFQEDHGRVRKDYAAENLSAVRRFVISRLKQMEEHSKESIRGRRKIAQWDRNYAMKIIFNECVQGEDVTY